jgi:hypothetical protein
MKNFVIISILLISFSNPVIAGGFGHYNHPNYSHSYSYSYSYRNHTAENLGYAVLGVFALGKILDTVVCYRCDEPPVVYYYPPNSPVYIAPAPNVHYNTGYQDGVRDRAAYREGYNAGYSTDNRDRGYDRFYK